MHVRKQQAVDKGIARYDARWTAYEQYIQMFCLTAVNGLIDQTPCSWAPPGRFSAQRSKQGAETG